MPTYEYACPHCNHVWEKREGFEASTKKKCPECGKRAQRVLFAPPIVFKGSGFYVTDSRKPESTSKDSTKESASGSDSKSASSEPSAPKSDAESGKSAESAAAS